MNDNIVNQELKLYTDNDRKRTGSFLKQLRTENKMSREQLSTVIAISPDSIARYERGERLPNAETISLLMQIFHVSFDEIMTGEKAHDMAQEVPETPHKDSLEINGHIDNSSLLKSLTNHEKEEILSELLKQESKNLKIRETRKFYKRLLFVIIVFLSLVLLAWFINLHIIRKTVNENICGTITKTVEEISLPEGETIRNDAK